MTIWPQPQTRRADDSGMTTHDITNAFGLQRKSTTNEPTSAIYDARANTVRELEVALPRVDGHDAQLLAILDAPAEPGVTASETFRRKEHELGAVFATLTAVESLALQQRLSNPKAGDELATKFNRMVVERRNRLLEFLAASRRRAACTRRVA